MLEKQDERSILHVDFSSISNAPGPSFLGNWGGEAAQGG